MEFVEIETKYRVKDTKLDDYLKLAGERKPKRTLNVSGWDYYFVDQADADSFIRYRASPTEPQLTMKRKTKSGNNFVRREVNLPLSMKANVETVTALCEDLGFKFSFKIWKSCWIHWYDRHNTVFYIVSDDNLKEQDRFIEIEMDEDHPWSTVADAWELLTNIEGEIRSLGVSPQARLKKSLFEMFRP